jgi:CRISPR/Cas system-associated protein Cas7 (RAMP superfamily)
MKTTATFLMILLVATSCDIMVVEPGYDNRNQITGSYHIEEYSQTYNDYTSFFIYVRKSGFGQEVVIENF